jgi:hypothetical protein
MAIPQQFCWTRFGTEAAQSIEKILVRKEQERVANSGTFFWGIGNAVGPSLKELVRQNPFPEVLFSPIKGKPKAADVKPTAIAAWTSALGVFGQFFDLPDASLITSRYDPANPRSVHYALVCHSEAPLVLRHEEEMDAGSLRNLLSGRSVGASQVTAVVDHGQVNGPTSTYRIALRARLVSPYLVRLSSPLLLPNTMDLSAQQWIEAAHLCREARQTAMCAQLTLELAAS